MNTINTLKAGDEGVLVKALITNVVTGKTNGANRATYLSLTLQDKTGSIDAKLWSATPQQVEEIVTGCVILAKADIIKYNDDRQMKIIKIEVSSKDPAMQVHYLKSAPIDSDSLIKEVDYYISSIRNISIQTIVMDIYNSMKEDFKIYPAASKNHHEYVSGLAHHTLGMLKLADSLCVLYPSLNPDLLYAGVVLHDIGKIIELSGPVLPEYTLKGKLLGHISICQAMVKETANRLGIDGEEVTLLQHLVLSHHGKNEYGSPVLPMIKEAEILHFIDNIDARMNMLDKALDLVDEGEFTKRVFSLENRSFYKPELYKK